MFVAFSKYVNFISLYNFMPERTKIYTKRLLDLVRLMFARMFASYHQNQWGTSANVNKYFGTFTTLVTKGQVISKVNFDVIVLPKI